MRPELDPRCDIAEHVARAHPNREAPLLSAFMARLADLDAAPPSSALEGDAGVRLAQDLLALSSDIDLFSDQALHAPYPNDRMRGALPQLDELINQKYLFSHIGMVFLCKPY